MSLAIDEYGRPFIIIREQEKKKRLKGKDALKSNIIACASISNILRTSLGPKGMDKMIMNPDGEILITNDGATILEKMEIEHKVARLLVELSKSQDNEIGDGTTGVVVLAGALLEHSVELIDKGIHPLKISCGYEKACDIAVQKIKSVAIPMDISVNNNENLKRCAMTALGSKVVCHLKEKIADIVVNAVLKVADMERKDVNLDMIKVVCKPGGSLEDIQFIDGILIDKEFSHPQMVKEVKDAKICILTCSFEPPKPKTKHKIDVTSVEDYQSLYKQEQNYFTKMIDSVKKSGANIALCQWGFDDEANHLLMQNSLPAIRYVGGVEVELIAMATGARIIPRFEEITPEKLGKASCVRELRFGTNNDQLSVIEGCSKSKAVSILIRGGSSAICEEAKRSIHDAICVVRNLIKDNRVVTGGGSIEIACSIEVDNASVKEEGFDSYALKAYSDALDTIPFALAENSGYNPIDYVQQIKNKQVAENNPRLGVDCLIKGTNDMSKQNVFETMQSKIQQLQLSTQVAKMIMKIDDIVSPNDYE